MSLSIDVNFYLAWGAEYMTVCTNEDYDIYDGLKHNFLYNKDANCIHMLLNLYDLEENIRNIYPKYISIKYLRSHIAKFFKDRAGNQMIAKNLGELIHEDINRLELFLYMEGYKYGFYNKPMANSLESLTIKYYSIEELYSLKYLFHFENTNEEILEFKESIYAKLEHDDCQNSYLYDGIKNYISVIIKTKIFSLNKYLDKQLTIDYSSNLGNIKEDSTLLTKEDLNGIYNEVFKIVIKNGMKLYKDACWNGLNDKVLKRYR